MKMEACVWCSKIVRAPDDYNPYKQDIVCSQACAEKERWFRYTYSDKKIGERNYRDHGINHNHRGGGRCTGK